MDFDKLLTNKYFCLALLTIIAILVYMIYEKTSCKRTAEGLNSVPLMNGPQHIVDKPYEEGTNDGYRRVNDKFDKMIDEESRKKLKIGGFDDQDNLKSSSDTFMDYSKAMREYLKKPFYNNDAYELPRPLDNHPELSQCQPCNCDK